MKRAMVVRLAEPADGIEIVDVAEPVPGPGELLVEVLARPIQPADLLDQAAETTQGQPSTVGDHRGFLARLFCAETLAATGWTKPIAQINHTHTAKQGTVRGLHFQYPPHAEMKLVSW